MKGNYKERLERFERKFSAVKAMDPKEGFLHTVMDSVAFQDLEVDLDLAIARKEGKDPGAE